MKQSKRRKSLKIEGPCSHGTSSNGRNESVDDPISMSERERHLEQQMEETLDHDIMRSSASDHESSTTSVTSCVDSPGRSNEKNKWIPSVNTLPSPSRRELNSFRDLFNTELDRFTAINLSVRTRHNVDLNSLLWNTFGQ